MRAPSVLISIGIHVAAFGAILWMTAPKASMLDDPGLPSGALRNSSGTIGGLGVREPAPTLGPSVLPGEAREYVGKYSVAHPRSPDLEMLISRVSDGDDHWSLVVHGDSLHPYKLLRVSRDTFAQLLVPARRIVFARRDSTVVAIELHFRGTIRRGVKVPDRQ